MAARGSGLWRARLVEAFTGEETYELIDALVLLIGVGVNGSHDRLAVEEVDERQQNGVELFLGDVARDRERAAELEDLPVEASREGFEAFTELRIGSGGDHKLIPSGVHWGPTCLAQQDEAVLDRNLLERCDPDSELLELTVADGVGGGDDQVEPRVEMAEHSALRDTSTTANLSGCRFGIPDLTERDHRRINEGSDRAFAAFGLSSAWSCGGHRRYCATWRSKRRTGVTVPRDSLARRNRPVPSDVP